MRLTSPNYGCHSDLYTNEIFDERFKSIDFEDFGISEFTLHSESGVIDILNSIPHIDLFYLQYSLNPMNIKKNYIYKLLMRDPLHFSRSCELYGDYTRQQAFDILEKVI